MVPITENKSPISIHKHILSFWSAIKISRYGQNKYLKSENIKLLYKHWSWRCEDNSYNDHSQPLSIQLIISSLYPKYFNIPYNVDLYTIQNIKYKVFFIGAIIFLLNRMKLMMEAVDLELQVDVIVTRWDIFYWQVRGEVWDMWPH